MSDVGRHRFAEEMPGDWLRFISIIDYDGSQSRRKDMASTTPIEHKSSRDSALARDSGERLARAVSSTPNAALTISVGSASEPITLPRSAAKLLIEGLAELAKGE